VTSLFAVGIVSPDQLLCQLRGLHPDAGCDSGIFIGKLGFEPYLALVPHHQGSSVGPAVVNLRDKSLSLDESADRGVGRT
jgi:hypothetical protein